MKIKIQESWYDKSILKQPKLEYGSVVPDSRHVTPVKSGHQLENGYEDRSGF